MLNKTDEPGSRTISQSSREHREQKRAQKSHNPAQDYAQSSRHHPRDLPNLHQGLHCFSCRARRWRKKPQTP